MRQLSHQHNNALEAQRQWGTGVQRLRTLLQTAQCEAQHSNSHQQVTASCRNVRVVTPLIYSQVNRPLTMKKEGIQTRNRKVSNKNKKGKKAALLEPYPDMAQPPPLDDNGGPFSLGPGTLLSYSHTPHLLPTPTSLHPSATLPYPHHLNSGMVPTLV